MGYWKTVADIDIGHEQSCMNGSPTPNLRLEVEPDGREIAAEFARDLKRWAIKEKTNVNEISLTVMNFSFND